MQEDRKQLIPVTISAMATSATSDDALLESWIASLNSDHSRRNFRATATRFLAALGVGLRGATVEAVRSALAEITAGLAASSARQVVLRVKSLLSYAHRLGYLQFNAGAVIKVKAEARALSKRIISEVEVRLLVRAAQMPRDRVLVQLAYAGGLRVSELVNLTWADALVRSDGKIQLHVLGKGGREREVLLPDPVARAILALRGDAGVEDPVFCSRKATEDRKDGRHPQALTERAVNHILKRVAARAGVNPNLSAHWLRHAHASHAIDRGAALPVVQATLGHANIAVTSGYLHARPDTSSALHLDEGVFLR